jgi:AcrR family transcriptional regulator
MPYRTTPARVAHAERVRESILDAAADVLRTHGIDGLTVRRVVARAGSSTGAYYNHFADKEDLLAALVDRLADRIGARIDQISRSGAEFDDGGMHAGETAEVGAADHHRDVRSRLELMVRTGITAALEDRDLSQVLFLSDSGERVRTRIRHRFLDRTREFFVREPVGVAAMIDPKLVAVLWQGSILMLVEQFVSGELEMDVAEAAQLCAEWNLRALGL